MRVIEEEIKPFVMARYHVDPARQTLYSAFNRWGAGAPRAVSPS